jgi:hypothetical protein
MAQAGMSSSKAHGESSGFKVGHAQLSQIVRKRKEKRRSLGALDQADVGKRRRIARDSYQSRTV